MNCDGPGYEHMDGQGILALITGGDNDKEADKAVEDKIVVYFLMLKPCRK